MGFRALLAIFCLIPALALGQVNLAAAPIGRMDLPWWKLRFHQSLVAARADPDAEIVWLGDSITEFWQRESPIPAYNILPVWQHYYAPYHALDFGLHPRLTIILIGANNLGRVHWDAAMSVPGIEAVVAKTHELLPASHILLLGVLPSIRSAWVDENTMAINTALARDYAGSSVVTFINVSRVLMRDGRTDAALFIDPGEVPPEPALHPDAEGMARIAAFIQPKVQQYLR
jgi:hypothetical protein